MDINEHLDNLNDIALNYSNAIDVQNGLNDYCKEHGLDPEGFEVIVEDEYFSIDIAE